VVGCEHDPTGRRELVEARLGKIELLRVADAIVDLEAELLGTFLRRLDERRGEIDARHARAALGRELGDRARPAGEVEQVVARLGRQSPDDRFVDV
jgi:hypothetical protein